MFIKSLSLFELVTYPACISKQLRLLDKAFKITYLLDCFCKSTTTGVVEIEIVPIKHTSAQTLWHVYFSIIANYFDIVDIVLGVTRSSVQNICTEFVIYISQFLLLFYLYSYEI